MVRVVAWVEDPVGESLGGGAKAYRQQEGRVPRDVVWAEYLRKIAAADEQALASLYDESSPLVYSIATRMLGNPADAEEIVGDVYSQVWRSASRWDEGRGTVTAWLVTLCRTRSIDRIRSRSARQQVETPMPSGEEGALQAADSESNAHSFYERQVLRAALDQLRSSHRELLEMAFFSGLTHAELSERLGLPLGTVKTRIRSAVLRMRDLLQEHRA
jgi:RNA polymerase sigma-70 factor (ECF subfamily)